MAKSRWRVSSDSACIKHLGCLFYRDDRNFLHPSKPAFIKTSLYCIDGEEDKITESINFKRDILTGTTTIKILFSNKYFLSAADILKKIYLAKCKEKKCVKHIEENKLMIQLEIPTKDVLNFLKIIQHWQSKTEYPLSDDLIRNCIKALSDENVSQIFHVMLSDPIDLFYEIRLDGDNEKPRTFAKAMY